MKVQLAWIVTILIDTFRHPIHDCRFRWDGKWWIHTKCAKRNQPGIGRIILHFYMLIGLSIFLMAFTFVMAFRFGEVWLASPASYLAPLAAIGCWVGAGYYVHQIKDDGEE